MAELLNTVRAHRDRLGLSQRALAEHVGVTRQAIAAIEAGQQIPSTALALRLARAVSRSVEDLFEIASSGDIQARLAPHRSPFAPPSGPGDRVALARIAGRWVAHPLASDGHDLADGVIAPGTAAGAVSVRPMTDPGDLEENVLVAGCAPLLGALARTVGERFSDSRITWLPASSRRALDLLAGHDIHVAGLHMEGVGARKHARIVRAAFPGRRMLVTNLTRWRLGLVVASGNPLGLKSLADLGRPDVRVARREAGSGAQMVLTAALDAPLVRGPIATDHRSVALLVRAGAADVGVAIESAAVAAGLDFVPVAEERFDLVVSAEAADQVRVARLLEGLDRPAFRAEVAHRPGHDGALTGHVTTIDPAREPR